MLSDTSSDAAEKYYESLRQLGEAGRAELARQLTLAVQRLAFTGLRQRFPAVSDDEIWLRLAVERLGPDLVRDVYGFEIDGS